MDKIIGHRGACAYAPENTLASFNQAFIRGCRFIEFDVMCSRDGEPFIFHDQSLKRTSNGSGELGLVEAAYLQDLDVGSWFSSEFKNERIVHLKEAIDWLIFCGVHANIEIKPYPGTASSTTIAVLKHIQAYWPQNKPLPLVSSFEWDALVLCRQIAPEMPLGLLIHEWDEHCLQKAKQLACFSVHFNKKIVNEQRVQVVKNQGYACYVYTVNNKAQANKLFNWGVDAVFSDYPDLISTLK